MARTINRIMARQTWVVAMLIVAIVIASLPLAPMLAGGGGPLGQTSAVALAAKGKHGGHEQGTGNHDAKATPKHAKKSNLRSDRGKAKTRAADTPNAKGQGNGHDGAKPTRPSDAERGTGRQNARTPSGRAGSAGKPPVNPPMTQTSKPLAPTLLQATETTTTTIALFWQDKADVPTKTAWSRTPETGYEVWRATMPIVAPDKAPKPVYAKIASLPAHPGTGPMRYQDKGLADGTRYCYIVKAVNRFGTGNSTAFCTATPLVTPKALSVVRVANNPTVLRITWTDGSTRETGTELQRQVDGGPWANTHANIPATGGATFTSGALARGGYYCYRVRVSNAVVSTDSPAVCQMTPLAAPEFWIDETRRNMILGWWDDTLLGEQYWTVTYHRKGSTVTSTEKIVVDPCVNNSCGETNHRGWGVGGLNADTEYCFSLSVVKRSERSPESPEVCDRTDPNPPPTSPVTKTDSVSINLQKHVPPQGFIWWQGEWRTTERDAAITGIRNPAGGVNTATITLLKWGRWTTECGDPDAVVILGPGKSTTASELAAITGGSKRSPVPLISCGKANMFGDLVQVEVTYTYTELQ